MEFPNRNSRAHSWKSDPSMTDSCVVNPLSIMSNKAAASNTKARRPLRPLEPALRTSHSMLLCTSVEGHACVTKRLTLFHFARCDCPAIVDAARSGSCLGTHAPTGARVRRLHFQQQGEESATKYRKEVPRRCGGSGARGWRTRGCGASCPSGQLLLGSASFKKCFRL